MLNRLQIHLVLTATFVAYSFIWVGVSEPKQKTYSWPVVIMWFIYFKISYLFLTHVFHLLQELWRDATPGSASSTRATDYSKPLWYTSNYSAAVDSLFSCKNLYVFFDLFFLISLSLLFRILVLCKGEKRVRLEATRGQSWPILIFCCNFACISPIPLGNKSVFHFWSILLMSLLLYWKFFSLCLKPHFWFYRNFPFRKGHSMVGFGCH